MKSTAEILELLRVFKAQSAAKYGLRRIGIFGSVARGEQTNQSDVDICYESEPPSLLTLERIQSELEELLGCSVETSRPFLIKGAGGTFRFRYVSREYLTNTDK